MSDVEDLLTRTLRDPARALPVPADPLPAIRARVRAQRRNAVLGAAAAVLVVVAAVLVPAVVGRLNRPLPPATGAGLLSWRPQGPAAGDADLAARAGRAWRDQGGARSASVLWAGDPERPTGRATVVLLQGRDAAGSPMLAELAVEGDGLRLVRSGRLPDPGIPAVELSGRPLGETLLVVPPDTQWLHLTPTPAEQVVEDHLIDIDGLVHLPANSPGLTPGRYLLARGVGRKLLGEGTGPVEGLAVPRGQLRAAEPTWRGPAGGVLNDEDLYSSAGVLAGLLDGTGPVQVALIDNTVTLDLPGGPGEPRLYELRRGGRTWLGSAVWLNRTPYCPRVREITGAVATTGADVLRCWVPPARGGVLSVLLADGVRLAGLTVAAAGPGQRPVTRTGAPIEGGLVLGFGRDFPTGPGRLTLVDGAGRPRPPLELPAYS